MLKRLVALSIVLLFASQTLAGGFACNGASDGKNSNEMACCAQAKSAASSPVAMLCCETVCGEPTSGTPGPQSETPGQSPQVPAPLVTVTPIPTFESLLAAVIALNSKRTMDVLLERLDPPSLYLHHSAFLI
ncbi:MAG: hypothetical protein MSG64_20295 [Pyrinomonadaceae bacterium MAG19_C2-C3]|nr:hypothetical protein [Pyrinomonadaceae bacterium MAG19_C2-C3]